MIPTIPYVEQKFKDFNQLIFLGRLPALTIQLSNAKTFLGMLSYKKKRRWDGSIEKYDYKLKINTRIELSEEELEDTIIHEMIHFYIAVRNVEDTSTHGERFKEMMDFINKKFGRHITISHKGTTEQREQRYDTKKKYHVVALVTFTDGKTGFKVIPRIAQRIVHYYNNVLRASQIKSVELYLTNHPFFNRFPNSASLKVHFYDRLVLEQHLAEARKINCNGRNIYF